MESEWTGIAARSGQRELFPLGGVIAKKAGLLAVFGLVLLKFAKILFVPVVLAGGWSIKRVRGG